MEGIPFFYLMADWAHAGGPIAISCSTADNLRCAQNLSLGSYSLCPRQYTNPDVQAVFVVFGSGAIVRKWLPTFSGRLLYF
jgi:hypothetical protein